MQSYKSEDNEEPVAPSFYSWRFCGNAAQRAGAGTCRIRGRENLLCAPTFEFPDCQNMHQVVRQNSKLVQAIQNSPSSSPARWPGHEEVTPREQAGTEKLSSCVQDKLTVAGFFQTKGHYEHVLIYALAYLYDSSL